MRVRGSRASVATALVVAAALLPGSSALADEGPPAPPRPGPDVLYAEQPSVPQLENRAPWRAEPLMVAGTDAYAGGEYVYQDYVYDDHGANTTDIPFSAPEPLPRSSDTSVGPQTGDLVYPTDAGVYAANAADLLEFRARLVPEGIAYRITLNTMLDPAAAGVAIGIDAGPGGASEWGFGIGSLGDLGLDHVIVASGDGAWLDGEPLAVSVDARTNQLEVVVPLEPAGATWRHFAGVGIWDPLADEFASAGDEPTPTRPGGAHGADAPPFFNVAFRFDEPVSRIAEECAGSRGATAFGCGHWREHGQAHALARRDISLYGADVDFDKLAAGVDESHVPTSGFMTRLFASHLDPGEGVAPSRPMLRGPIQPYGLYVPPGLDPAAPTPLHLQLHWLYGAWTEYAVLAPNLYSQLGDARGALVLTPMARGTDGWYHDEAEVDVFEAWADVARDFAIASDRVTIGGYSMGGYGTFRLASGYPDLFAAAFAIVPPSDESIFGGATGGRLRGNPVLEAIDGAAGAPSWGRLSDEEIILPVLDGLRHVPTLVWAGSNDANVPISGVLETQRRLHELGYEHELDVFLGFDHFAFHTLDQWAAGAAWLDRSLRAPAHLTYRVLPGFDRPSLGLVHDHAYWVSDARVATGAPSGLIDATSRAGGRPDDAVRDDLGAGLDPRPHVRRGLVATPGDLTTQENLIELELDDVASLTVWPEEARVDLSDPLLLRVTTSGAATVALRGSFGERTVALPPGHSEHVVVL